MPYRKLVDEEDFYSDVPGPAKENNAVPPLGGAVDVGGPPPGTGEPSVGADGEKSNREGGLHH